MDPLRHREMVMLLVNELMDRLRPLDKDHNLPVEVEKEIDAIDRRLTSPASTSLKVAGVPE